MPDQEPTQDAEMAAALAKGYGAIKNLFESLSEDPDIQDQRNKSLGHEAFLQINRVDSAAQRAFIVSAGGTSFYISEGGVQYLTVPDVTLNLDGTDFQQTIPVRTTTFDVSLKDRLGVTIMMVSWARFCAKTGQLRPSGLETSFALQKIRSLK